MTQRNAQMMDLRSGELQRSHDAAFAWKTMTSVYQALPCLRGFWGMGAHMIQTIGTWVNNQAPQSHSNHDLEVLGSAYFGYTGMVPWVETLGTSGAANDGNLEITADPASYLNYQITGGESYIDDPGLTVGAWWQFDSAIKLEGLMSKEDGVPQISWLMAKTGTSLVQFSVSGDGTATASAFSTNTVDDTSWHLLIGRYDPGSELVVFLNGVKGTPVVAGIPATLHNSTANLQIGNDVTGFTQNSLKRVSMAFICASHLSDTICQAIWHHTRAVYGR